MKIAEEDLLAGGSAVGARSAWAARCAMEAASRAAWGLRRPSIIPGPASSAAQPHIATSRIHAGWIALTSPLRIRRTIARALQRECRAIGPAVE